MSDAGDVRQAGDAGVAPTGGTSRGREALSGFAGESSWLSQNRALLIPYGLILLLLAAAAIRAPGFVSVPNLTQQLVLASYLGVIAGGQTLVILTGGIDLSIAWNLNLAAILLTQLSEQMPVFWATVAALGCAALVGLINGLGIAYLRIPSLVMTLGMNAVLAGVTLVYTNGSPQGEAPQFARDLAVSRIGGTIPWALLFWALFSAGLVFLLRRTVFGKRLYAIGNNPRASYLSGVPVRRVLVVTYTLCGLCAGLGGIMLTGYSQQSYLGMGDLYVLPAIAAVVIGGTSILGGSGGYTGTIAGAITVVLLQNVLQIVGIQPAGQQILYGVIILIMLFVYGRNARVQE
ncbi:MAG: ABC transporter permease [Chloroflexia bacterium]|nr:ABC transporter permease [Chloroflexia bacterium]